MTNTTSRFDGAVHDEASADVGSNRQDERVVRLDLTYTRGTAPSSTTMILTLDAAIALRNQLDGLFDAAGVDDSGGSVDEDDACPRCGERDQNSLVWQDDATIHCTNCGTRYDPDAKSALPNSVDQELLEAAAATLRLWNKHGLGDDDAESEPVHQALVNAVAKAKGLI